MNKCRHGYSHGCCKECHPKRTPEYLRRIAREKAKERSKIAQMNKSGAWQMLFQPLSREDK